MLKQETIQAEADKIDFLLDRMLNRLGIKTMHTPKEA